MFLSVFNTLFELLITKYALQSTFYWCFQDLNRYRIMGDTTTLHSLNVTSLMVIAHSAWFIQNWNLSSLRRTTWYSDVYWINVYHAKYIKSQNADIASVAIGMVDRWGFESNHNRRGLRSYGITSCISHKRWEKHCKNIYYKWLY